VLPVGGARQAATGVRGRGAVGTATRVQRGPDRLCRSRCAAARLGAQKVGPAPARAWISAGASDGRTVPTYWAPRPGSTARSGQPSTRPRDATKVQSVACTACKLAGPWRIQLRGISMPSP